MSRYYKVRARDKHLKTRASARFSDLDSVACWIVDNGGEHHGKAGFSVVLGGERCFLVITYHTEQPYGPSFYRHREIERSGLLAKFQQVRAWRDTLEQAHEVFSPEAA